MKSSSNINNKTKKKNSPRKRQKKEISLRELTYKVSEHYQSYLDSIEKNNEDEYEHDHDMLVQGEGDVDELHEIISLCQHRVKTTSRTTTTTIHCPSTKDPITMTSLFHSNIPIIHTNDYQKYNQLKSLNDFLPLFISLVYYHLAELSISEYMRISSKLTTNDKDEDDVIEMPLSSMVPTILHYLHQSLRYYRWNAATWSLGGHFGKMAHLLSRKGTYKWYEQAAICSSQLRTYGVNYMTNRQQQNEEEKKDNDNQKDVKDDIESTNKEEEEDPELFEEWIELLVLNQMAGVRYEGDDPSQNEVDDESITNQDGKESGSTIHGKDGDDDREDDESTDDGDGTYSVSAIEEMSRFMCAMIGSMEGQHDSVLQHHLRPFGFTHRIHPNVWLKPSIPILPSTPPPTCAPARFAPENGILPPHLFQKMKDLFAPNSVYWKESDYMSRGYYSFFMDYDNHKPSLSKTTKRQQRQRPKNLIEDVIVNHLLPRAKQLLSSEDGDQICGFEWWAHTRPIEASLGHNLHFDTDESILAQEGRITHPILSSILYLTGGNDGESQHQSGTTIVFDQTPHSNEVATRCWQGRPVDNTFLLFPGNLLHGVLPCEGTDWEIEKEEENDDWVNPYGRVVYDEGDDVIVSNLMKQWKSPPNREEETTQKQQRRQTQQRKTVEAESRLTFMVGFWTRNVPASMNERYLYGPCGPIPPSSKEHSWVQKMSRGYPSSSKSSTTTTSHENGQEDFVPCALPCVSPAWESIPPFSPKSDPDEEDSTDPPPPLLMPPRSIDHRFFVKDAPTCFYQSMFQGHDNKQDDTEKGPAAGEQGRLPITKTKLDEVCSST